MLYVVGYGLVWYGWGMVSCIRAGAFHQSRLIIQDWSTLEHVGARHLRRRQPRAIFASNWEFKKLGMGEEI